MEENMFAQAVPLPAPDADDAETEKWRKKGEHAARKNAAILSQTSQTEGRSINPISGSDATPADEPNMFSNIVPINKQTADSTPIPNLNNIPANPPLWMLKKIVQYMPSFNRPAGQAFSENMANLGRGVTEVGQGVKQRALGAGEYLGLEPAGTQAAYTRGTETERKNFEASSAGQDPLGQTLRSGVTDAPFAALTSLPLFGEAGMLAKLLQGAAGGGLAKNIEYRKPGEDPFKETVKGTVEGAAANLLPEIPSLAEGAYNKIKGSYGALKQDIPGLQAATDRAQAAYEAATGEHEAAQSTAKQAGLGTTDTDILEAKIAANKQKLAQVNQDISAQQTTGNPAQYFVDTPAEATSRLSKAQSAHQNAQDVSAAIDESIGQHLKAGAEHDVEAAKLVGQDLTANRKDIQKGYQTIEKNLADKEITIKPESTKSAQEINADLRKLVQENKADSPEATKLLEQLDTLGKNETIPANDYVSMYQSVNGYMRDAYKKGFQPGLNREQQLHWQNVGDQLSEKLEKMDAVLKDSLAPEDYALFSKTGSRWKNEVVPLYKNPVYHQIEKGKMPSNIMNSLRGTDEGNVIIRNAIQNNPEALKHAVGQRYEVNPDYILNPNDQVSAYTKNMPELQQLVEQKQNATNLENQAANHVDLQKQNKAQADQMKKDYDTKIENIQNMQQQKASLENTANLLDEHIAKLKQAAANKNATKDAYTKAQEALSKAEAKKKQVQSKLITIAKAAGIAVAGYGLTSKAYKAGQAANAITNLPGAE